MSVLTAGTCSRTEPQCSKVGVARCVTCKTLYCSAQCQAAHWPRHWRECLPLPDLEWLTQDDKKAVFVKKDPSSTQTSSGDCSDQVVYVGSAKLQDIAPTESFPTKKPTETEAFLDKTIDLCSTDSCSSLQGEASGTPVLVKTQPESSAAKDSAPSAVPVSLSPNVSVTKDKPSATLESPKDVAQVADPAITNAVKETSSEPSAVVKATSQTSGGPGMYPESQFSSNLPAQILTKKVNEIVSPLDVIRSPCDFIVRLADSVRQT